MIEKSRSVKIMNMGRGLLRAPMQKFHEKLESQVDRCMIYAIVRTESGFDQRDMSFGKAVGLM